MASENVYLTGNFAPVSEERTVTELRRVGSRYRYGYAPGVGGRVGRGGALLKHDLQAGKVATREFGAGKEAGEFVFEPAGRDAAEDDGVVMGFV